MTEPTKRPTGAAVGAALSPFVGLPLTFVFFLLAVGKRADDEFGGGGALSGVSQAWVEGGWPNYLVLGVGGLLAIVCALLIFFGVQRGSGAVMACAPIASMLVAVGAFGSWNSMNGSLAAVAHAAPADRAVIIAGSTAESLTNTLLGICAMAGLLSSLCLGLLLGVIAQQGVARRLLLAATGVFGSLVIVAMLFATRLQAVMASFRALAYLSPLDRLTMLVGVGEELARYKLPLVVGLVFVLVMAVVGAVLVKDTPRLAVLVPLMGLAGLFGFGAPELVRTSLDGAVASTAIVPPPLGLLELPGFVGMEPRWCIDGAQIVACDDGSLGAPVDADALFDELSTSRRQFDELHEAAGDEGAESAAMVGVSTNADAKTTAEFLRLARRAKVKQVQLVGEQTPKPRDVPSELKVLAAALDSRFRMVPVRVGAGDACGAGCKRATVEGEALVVGAERWTAGPVEGSPTSMPQQVAIEPKHPLAPATLVKLALAAEAKRHQLVLLVPEASLDGEADVEAEPGVTAPDPSTERKVVGDLMKMMFEGKGLGTPPPTNEVGGLGKDEIAKAVKLHSNEVKRCYEQALRKNPALAGKVVLRWVVKPTGSVANVTVSEDTLKDPAAVKCLQGLPATWKFPTSASGETVVQYPFSFAPAQ